MNTEKRIQDFSKQHEIELETQNLQIFYGNYHALKDASIKFPKNAITALIGGSGSGKSTFLRSFNRMNDDIADVQGQIIYQGLNINSSDIDVFQLRRQIGMVFQRPNPFLKSIYENIAFPLRESGIKKQSELNEIIESSLKKAALWDEVKDSLHKSALSLSGGQQQRLCIARCLAMRPKIILMDEPASALDPLSTSKLEITLQELKEQYTIIMVTHNMEQAARASDYTAFFNQGEIIEFDDTQSIFSKPKLELTERYITGAFG